MDAVTDPHQLATLPGLARKLVEQNLLDAHTASELRRDAVREGKPFVAYVVEKEAVSARAVAQVAAQEFAMPLVDLRAVDMANAPIKVITENLIRKHGILPIFQRGRRLAVAVADPSNQQPLHEFQFQSGLHIQPVLVEQDVLTQVIDQQFSDIDSAMAGFDGFELGDDTELALAEEDDATEDPTTNPEEDAPIVRFVNKILLDAIKQGASDIHFEPYEKLYRIRLRQDGVLSEIVRPPVTYSSRISARLKVMAKLDLAERRVPQDGRMKLAVSKNRAIDFRVSTCPTLYGEKVVLRILDPSSTQMGIEKLGYEDDQREIFESTIQRPYGMVLVTGPTGSGKTVSLYTAMSILNNEERNISTAEDPAEINLPGINQVNVHPRIGLTFASCLRSFLRQDPDVIMVGEIRDLETAEIAIKAAQTGHMVLSTVHTNDAPQTLTRLVNMGVPAYNIAASVSLIIAQRLARRLCDHCKTPTTLSREQLLAAGFREDEVDSLTLYDASEKGCERCTKGYKGRIGLYQVMPVTEAIGTIILQGGNSQDIDAQARKDGVLDLYQAGLNKVRKGLLNLSEVNRVTVD